MLRAQDRVNELSVGYCYTLFSCKVRHKHGAVLGREFLEEAQRVLRNLNRLADQRQKGALLRGLDDTTGGGTKTDDGSRPGTWANISSHLSRKQHLCQYCQYPQRILGSSFYGSKPIEQAGASAYEATALRFSPAGNELERGLYTIRVGCYPIHGDG